MALVSWINRVVLFAPLLALGAPAAAQSCSFCVTEVVLSKELGACYLERFQAELGLAEGTGLDFHLINLSDCAAEGTDRSARSMPDPRQAAPETDSSFLIEPTAMACLAELIENEDFDPEEVVTFDVANDCQD